MLVPPPRTEEELLQRARRLAGRTLGDLAQLASLEVPADQRRAKGWVGNLLELHLGATAASRPTPDFELLGVEMKTIPVGTDGAPRESTFVATLDLAHPSALTWEGSAVRKKLARILWVPVEAEPTIPMADRRVGVALLWSPTPDEEAALRKDFEEIAELISDGFLDQVTAHRGEYLQLRPKGANAKALRWAVGEHGERVKAPPRGFYLRPSFTAALLRRHYAG